MQIRKRFFPRLNGHRWEVDLGKVNGKRVQKFFRTKEAAEKYLQEESGKLQQHGHAALALTEDERVRFQAARDRLAAAGATIEQAVDHYLRTHRAVAEELTMEQALKRCLLAKELAGLRKAYLRTFASSVGNFVTGRGHRPITSVTKAEVVEWLRGNAWAPKTQRGYLGDVRAWLQWAVDERLLSSNPLAGEDGWVELPKMEDAEIASFDVDQCRRLLKAALFGEYVTFDREAKEFRTEKTILRELLGYLALAMFAGIRPAEIGRLTITALDLRERTVVVRGAHSKTRTRRVIELDRVAVIWLRLWRRLCPEATKFVPKNFDRKWDGLRKEAKLLKGWPHDVLRHTFATFHFAQHADTAALQAVLGHSEDEDTLFRHYRAVRTVTGLTVSRKLAGEFWALTPRRVRLWKPKEEKP